MALTDVQNEFLKLQLANNPEFQAEYFPNVITQGPSGPLYNVNLDYNRPANVRYEDFGAGFSDDWKAAEYRDINVPYDTHGSRLNIKATPEKKYMMDHYHGFPRVNPGYTDYAYMKPQELYHEGKPITGGQTQAINMAPWLLEAYGTAPTSPRNQMTPSPDWWHQAGKHFDFETRPTVDQATLNDFIKSILAHETSHGVSGKPDYKKITEGAESFDFSEFLTPNIKQGHEALGRHDISKMSEMGLHGYKHAQEELFTRMKDIERLKIENPDNYEEHPLWELYQTRARQQFARLTGQNWQAKGSLGKFNLYKKKIKPYVDKYFQKVRDKASGTSNINIRKREVGMPEHLTPPPPPPLKKKYNPPRGGGADVMPVGRPRPDKPGGFTDPGKGSYGPHKADGGLINYFKYGGYLG